MNFRRKQREEPRVDMTPMVDVVFLLLIFFMISTTFVETPGLSIELPESSTQVAEKEPQEIKIYLSKAGEIFHKEQKLTIASYKELLEENSDKADQVTFMLLADKEAKHGKVVQVMDLAQAAGFRKLAIATEHRELK